MQSNAGGKLGYDGTVSIGKVATDMSKLAFVSFASSLNNLGVAEVSAGASHTCALFLGGRVACFGLSSNGSLGSELAGNIGDGTNLMVDLVPIAFQATIIPIGVVQVASGMNSVCGTGIDT